MKKVVKVEEEPIDKIEVVTKDELQLVIDDVHKVIEKQYELVNRCDQDMLAGEEERFADNVRMDGIEKKTKAGFVIAVIAMVVAVIGFFF